MNRYESDLWPFVFMICNPVTEHDVEARILEDGDVESDCVVSLDLNAKASWITCMLSGTNDGESIFLSNLTPGTEDFLCRKVEGKRSPDPKFGISKSFVLKFCNLQRFSPSITLPQKLACKQSWTESELAEVVGP